MAFEDIVEAYKEGIKQNTPREVLIVNVMKALVKNHEEELDPHPQYLTAADIAGDGGSETFSGIAGQILGGGKVVYSAAGKFYLYNPMDENLYRAPVGITKHAANADAPIQVQVMGVFTEVGLGLTPDEEYFAGPAGTLVLDPTSYTVMQYVGRAISANSLFINFQIPIVL